MLNVHAVLPFPYAQASSNSKQTKQNVRRPDKHAAFSFTRLRQHLLRNVDPREAHDIGDEVQQELEGVVAKLPPAAAVAVEQQVAYRVQGQGVARHAREPHVAVAIFVPRGGLEDEPKRLPVGCFRIACGVAFTLENRSGSLLSTFLHPYIPPCVWDKEVFRSTWGRT